MNKIDDSLNDFIKYLKKLSLVIERESSFTFFSIKLIDTKRLDDVFCCIDASWPSDYKRYIEQFGDLHLKSKSLYKDLKLATKNKFVLTSSLCIVYHKRALSIINMLISAIKSDLRFIHENKPGFFN